MRRTSVLVISVLVISVLALSSCPAPPPQIVIGEGEGEGEGDGGEGEGEGDGGEGEGEGEGDIDCIPADLVELGDADKPRVVLVGHPFSAGAGDGTAIRSMTLTGTTLVDDGVRIDIGLRPQRIEFVPSGRLALVVSDDAGQLASVRVDSPTVVSVVDTLDLGAFGFTDMRVLPSAGGVRVLLVNFDSQAGTAGVHTVHVACDGTLTLDASAFFAARLSSSIALLSSTRALLLGGQVLLFDPIDANDLRLLDVDVAVGAAPTEVAAFDLWVDGVNATRIAASADGTRALVPNKDIFSNDGNALQLLSIAGDVVAERDRVTGLDSASEALFSVDGDTALLARPEANTITVFDVSGDTLVQTEEVGGIGLGEQMAIVARGAATDLVLISATDVTGPNNVQLLRIVGVGDVDDLGQIDIGDGGENIPEAIAVQP